MTIADRREYRDTILKCPFCLAPMDAASAVKTPFGVTVDGGTCAKCGAIYILDRSGKNLGESYADALAMAFGWDYDMACNAPEGSYEEAVARYMPTAGKYVLGEGERGDRCPKYLFIKKTGA